MLGRANQPAPPPKTGLLPQRAVERFEPLSCVWLEFWIGLRSIECVDDVECHDVFELTDLLDLRRPRLRGMAPIAPDIVL